MRTGDKKATLNLNQIKRLNVVNKAKYVSLTYELDQKNEIKRAKVIHTAQEAQLSMLEDMMDIRKERFKFAKVENSINLASSKNNKRP